MPSYRHHDFGNLYIQFGVRFPKRLGGEDSGLSEQDVKALERILPPRIPDQLPPPDAMVEDFVLEDVDPAQQARSRGMTALDEDEDDMHPHAERVQCASQ